MPNDLTAVVPQILAQGLLALKARTILPFLVNRSYSNEAQEIGDTITVPIPSAITAQDVVPGATPPSTADVAPTKVDIKLDKWKEAPFYLTDKDEREATRGIIPMEASEAIKSLAKKVNADLFGEYLGVYGYVGTAGTTPFASDYTTGTAARKILLLQESDMEELRMVLDPDAEEKAINLSKFADSGFAGENGVISRGVIGLKLGFDWFMDQQVPTHTKGDLLAAPLVNDAARAIGETTVDIDKATLTGSVVVGDIFTVAGDTQTYVVTKAATASSNAIVGMEYLPGAKVAWADDAIITFKATHVVNLAFHRDAFALATRPLASGTQGLGSIIRSLTDPASGLTLRLEVSREHKRTRYSFDILYGVKLVRAPLAVRVAG